MPFAADREYKPLTGGLPNHPTSSMVCSVAPWRLQFEDSKASQRLSNCSLHATSKASIHSLHATHGSISAWLPALSATAYKTKKETSCSNMLRR